jgi:hypothetical protein
MRRIYIWSMRSNLAVQSGCFKMTNPFVRLRHGGRGGDPTQIVEFGRKNKDRKNRDGRIPPGYVFNLFICWIAPNELLIYSFSYYSWDLASFIFPGKWLFHFLILPRFWTVRKGYIWEDYQRLYLYLDISVSHQVCCRGLSMADYAEL